MLCLKLCNFVVHINEEMRAQKESLWKQIWEFGFILGTPARSRELSLMILSDPFEFEILYDSKNHSLLYH